ncbi:MAG: signal peptide peptidase SppA [Flavobacteriales bacterium]|nr:signal peptide peptidase SppA [Flavobacteriales bacterium]
MRQFLKFMLASMLGSLLIGIVLIVLFICSLAALGSAFSMEGKAPSVSSNSFLRISLDQVVVDRGAKEPFSLDFGPFKGMGKLGLNDILDDIEKAKKDDRIKGVFLDLGMVNAGFTTVKEIRDKLIAFKAESGKPVVAFADTYTQKSYYLASVADKVYMVPQGDLDFRGLRSEMMFYTGLFEKLGIEIQFIRGSDNKFKSFGEAFTRKDMSPANKMQVTRLLDGIWGNYITEVGALRQLDTAKLNAIAENMMVRKAQDAVTTGLVDSLVYRDEVLAGIKERMNLDIGKDINFVDLNKYTKAYVAKAKPEKDASEISSWKKPKVAVVYAQGDIVDGDGEDGSIGGTTLSEAIRKAREDSTVKAVVLRVNSPGGSGLASDVIWREVMLAKAVKPVVVSMGDVAASGGYYISCAADKIFAEPTTITGSIGVFGMIPNMQGFFNDKLGLTFDGVQTHKYAGMLTVTRPLTADEKGIIQGFIDNFYSTFTQRVAEGRHMEVAAVDSIGQGRVWTGTDAKRIGLVDEMGGLEAATAEAAKLADLGEGEYRTVGYPEQKDFFEQLKESLNVQARTWVAKEAFGDDVELLHRFEAVRKVRTITGIQARMPFEMDIH